MLLAVLLMAAGLLLWLGAVAVELIAIGLAIGFTIWVASSLFKALSR